MKKGIVFLSILVIILTSCKKEGNKNAIEIIEVTPGNEQIISDKNVGYESTVLNVKFSDSRYNDVYKHYIHIKNALVNSDIEGAKVGAQNIGTAFANLGVDQVLMDEAYYISSEDDLELQREAFSVLGNEVTKILSKAHIASGKIYKQYCPMAFDFKGAYWLSTEKEIRNPYFGDAMLKCGEVKEEIK